MNWFLLQCIIDLCFSTVLCNDFISPKECFTVIFTPDFLVAVNTYKFSQFDVFVLVLDES